jgi:hypothetical protein
MAGTFPDNRGKEQVQEVQGKYEFAEIGSLMASLLFG